MTPIRRRFLLRSLLIAVAVVTPSLVAAMLSSWQLGYQGELKTLLSRQQAAERLHSEVLELNASVARLAGIASVAELDMVGGWIVAQVDELEGALRALLEHDTPRAVEAGLRAQLDTIIGMAQGAVDTARRHRAAGPPDEQQRAIERNQISQLGMEAVRLASHASAVRSDLARRIDQLFDAHGRVEAIMMGMFLLAAIVVGWLERRQFRVLDRTLLRRLERLGLAMADDRVPEHVQIAAGQEPDEIDLMHSRLRAMLQRLAEQRDAERAYEQQLRANIAALEAANANLHRAQEQLLQSEKMAAVGQLAAGVAHEINNPLAFVTSNCGALAQYVADLVELLELETAALQSGDREDRERAEARARDLDLEFLIKDLRALLEENRDGLGRIGRIVAALKDFSRRHPEAFAPADLNAHLDNMVNLARNELKHKAEIVRDFGDLPPVLCVVQQIEQVFLNLLINAAQAIEGFGTITLRTRAEGDQVLIEVSDTGKGVPAAVAKRIFEPFFTTKPVGEGTGLGLSVVYGIVEKHGGSIRLDTSRSVGACFQLRLPLNPQASMAPVPAPGAAATIEQR